MMEIMVVLLKCFRRGNNMKKKVFRERYNLQTINIDSADEDKIKVYSKELKKKGRKNVKYSK